MKEKKPTFEDLFDILGKWCKGYKTVGDAIIAQCRRGVKRKASHCINRFPRVREERWLKRERV